MVNDDDDDDDDDDDEGNDPMIHPDIAACAHGTCRVDLVS